MPSNTQLDPEDFAGPSDNLWNLARREYLAGMTAASVCQRYGMSLSTFRLHARVGPAPRRPASPRVTTHPDGSDSADGRLLKAPQCREIHPFPE